MEDVPEATGGVRLAAGPGPQVAGLWRTGELLAGLGGLVLTLGAFMGWYSVEGDLRGRLSVLAVLLLLGLRAFGVELPPSIPDGLVIAGLGLTATILVLIRLIDIPEKFEPAVGRGIGLWLSLLAALLLIVAGLLKSAEDA